ncbi:hypothetical protein HPB48_011787 [Haemaphysalis longicornis]|uniref:alkaline phosphatase n=1 Tax=Haemaphysalis longicornis TaxID=44386 RepID=A0A9J6FXS2_HAELO|nr:hypothetical protein HPB48_011787 [Haemaphysalis longicornis]
MLFQVIMGGGRKVFLNKTHKDPEGKNGSRKDGKNLIESWIKLKENSSAAYVWNKSALLQVNTTSTEYLLGMSAISSVLSRWLCA